MNLQDQFSNFFSNRVVEMLAGAVGLNPSQAQSALRAILPRQLDGLADLASNPQTATGLGDLWASNDLPHDPEQVLATPDGLSRLETLGQGLSSRLFGGQASWLSDAAQHAGGNQNAVSRLSNLALPLLLSFLGRSGVNPQNAASQLTGMRGALSAMLPVAGVTAATGAVTEIVDSVAARPGVEVREGQPVAAAPAPKPTPAPAPEPERHLTAAPQEKSGFNPLWLLPLLLLGGLAWYLSQQRETPLPAPTTSQTTTSTTTTTSSTTTSAATTDEGIVVGNIDDGAQLPLEPFVLSGTAPANDVLTITNQAGEVLGSETADENGKWEIQMPAPLAGANAYTVTGTPSNAVSNFTVEGVEGAAGSASGTAAATASDAAVSGVTTSETTTTTTTTTTSAATASDAATGTAVTITEPASGASVGADSFNIVGQGQPNATYSLYEDGVNVGTFFADDTGAFTADVLAPQTGDRNYILTDEKGNKVATLPVVVTEPVAAADCSANSVLTLSLDDGDTVSAPFRFGGLGSAKEYTVRVMRGDKEIGKTVVPNGANCAWSYLSDPGGEGAELGEITYEVTPAGSDKPDSTITLNVVQSGANFKGGQYVGPTN